MWAADALLSMISHAYRRDRTRPGLVLSKLDDGVYASIARYDTPWGSPKVVVCSIQGASTSEAACEQLLRMWCAVNSVPVPQQAKEVAKAKRLAVRVRDDSAEKPKDRFELIEID